MVQTYVQLTLFSAGAPLGGRDKLRCPDSPLYPTSSAVWQDALLLIDHNARLGLNLSGYAFPEPGLFVMVTSTEKQQLYILTWLRIHPLLIANVSSSPWKESLVANKSWRSILTFTFGSHSTKSPEACHLLLNILHSAVESDLQHHNNSALTWNHENLTPETILDTCIIKEIIWELTKLNFQFEVAALDDYLLPNSLPTCQASLQHCFIDAGTGPLLAPALPRANDGLAAVSFEAHLPYLFAIRDLMLDWPEVEQHLLLPQVGLANWEEREEIELNQLEKTVATVYSKTFYRIVGRPPIVPHHLVLTS